jgi:Cation/multidrug efflux pump
MNKKFTDIFIDRPVLASRGQPGDPGAGPALGRSAAGAAVSVHAERVVTVTTPTRRRRQSGGSFITTPLENAIAQANGIDYMTSSSVQSSSTITANLRLNYDPDKALTEINTKVNSVLNQLPAAAQKPVLTVSIGQTIDAMYIGFYSDVLKPNQITDYITRSVQPRLQSVDGVQTAEILGAKNFALRAWLDPNKLAPTA